MQNHHHLSLQCLHI
ncbi:hypothetical protein F383_27067 [Gossypium arboreum]|uniref:Uncharacterized protein n=1 Tax=Gossypium arboreum TaxID=29729 RepID=A0A0B0PBU9_GOSAR|nr:hypothetical protein F383_27067 [Gossypium arboreum]